MKIIVDRKIGSWDDRSKNVFKFCLIKMIEELPIQKLIGLEWTDDGTYIGYRLKCEI